MVKRMGRVKRSVIMRKGKYGRFISKNNISRNNLQE